MFLHIGGQFWHQTRVSDALSAIRESAVDGEKKFFSLRSYGLGLNRILIGLQCHFPYLKHRRRVRLKRKDLTLSMDVMLDFDLMMNSTDEERCRHVAQRLWEDVVPTIAKYKLSDFDVDAFEADFHTWLVSTGYLARKASSTLDNHL
jgi:hypothetical protein